ncbi:MAG: class I SAM-dependent methyltransferase [Candidatus Gastranaerophilales bacterium]|nr:class I SAM-dependent methyltransferase [Candidatus Gastranaerophilales bacterium]
MNENYMNMQKNFYDKRAVSVDDAKKLVSLDYEIIARQARSFAAFAIRDYLDRKGSDIKGNKIDEILDIISFKKNNMKVLDFGCGVGRIMQEFVKNGYLADGVDISEKMIQHAKKNEILQDCNFYLANGNDCGNAPQNYYDLVYSMITIQHICVRSIRNKILESIHNTLNQNGTIYLQMNFYPSINASQIPENHAKWSEDKTCATCTNSAADVWITPEMLGEVYSDFSGFFKDIRFQFIDFANNSIDEAYPIKWIYLIISASKTDSLVRRIYKYL